MKAMFLRWLVAGILGLGVIFTVSSEDVAKPEPEAATLTPEEMETILDTKFSEEIFAPQTRWLPSLP